ncbi:DNA methyltransferase [Streptomyces sp. NPDC048306]|uniref:DNA-methyltransferase n=1 Tax=Streptomyces sp. NPDC048306 TaxID=3154502 RepID=UPI0033E5A188
MADPIRDREATVHFGDALAWLQTLETASVDAVVTDPPYSSGGLLRSDRANTTSTKYSDGQSQTRYADFSGDNRDQRGWAYWMTLWLGEALRVTKPGGALVMFCDWRQLPTASDAVQSGGWVWRGLVPWIKPASRPQQGRFTQNAEFVVWASNGPMPIQGDCLPGYYMAQPPRANEGRTHITQKPVDVVRSLVRIAPRGGLIIDPFAGSGTTGVACVLEGRRFAGCENTAVHHAAAVSRLAIAAGEAIPHGRQIALDLSEA